MAKHTIVYIGTYTQAPYTQGNSEGIYIYRLDPASGALGYSGVMPGVANPSFLAVDPQRCHLYAVNELLEFDGQPSGAVSAFAIDPETGALTFLNQQPSHGGDPCHLCVDHTGSAVLVANYNGATVSVLPILEGGRLGEVAQVIQHEGSSVHPTQQDQPHPHAVLLDPDNRFAFVAEKGLDRIMIYRFDSRRRQLTPHVPPWIQVAAGSGPRQFDFDPNGRYAYLINELNSTLTAFAYDDARGVLTELQTVPTLPDGFHGRSAPAQVYVHPSGRFVYGSNRGHDSIVTYAVDEVTGRLTYVGHEPTQGQAPRHFAIDPTGAFLFAANQRTDTVVTFRIDPQTGQLRPTDQVTEVPSPVCILMVPASS